MTCRIDQTLCKTPDEVKLRGFDFTAFLANLWTAATIYAVDDVVRPRRANGYQYRATQGGQSGTSTPNFRASDGATVNDGTVIWQAEAIGNESLRATISDSEWSANDSAITFSAEAVDSTGGRQRTSANIHGGIAGSTYLVINTVTFSDGEVEEMGIEVEIAEAVPLAA